MLKISFNAAGLICIYNDLPGDALPSPWWGLHLFVKRRYWIFGYDNYWFDGPIREFGFGPFFLFVWGE